MNFIEKLDLLKKRTGDNNSTLARNSGIAYTTIDGLYKKGYSNMKLSTLQALSAYFGVTIDYLAKDDEIIATTASELPEGVSVKDEIAKNIMYYRKKSGMTQKELASRLGVKNTAVSNWESGNNSIDIETLFIACEVFGVTLNDMYGRYSEPVVEMPEDEAKLLSGYRALSDQGKEYILQTLDMASRVYIKSSSAANVENEMNV